MDYEKLYNEALERCRKLYNEAKANEYTSDIEDYETIFPELKESEDDRIRKVLTRVLNENVGNGIEKYGAKLEDALAWLERQGEQKPIWHNEDEEPKEVVLFFSSCKVELPLSLK